MSAFIQLAYAIVLPMLAPSFAGAQSQIRIQDLTAVAEKGVSPAELTAALGTHSATHSAMRTSPNVYTSSSSPSVYTGASSPNVYTSSSSPNVYTGGSSPSVYTGGSTPSIYTRGPAFDVDDAETFPMPNLDL